ncbi:MAG: PD-(D/E)XK nuclease family protein [Methanomassiliicoccus sp.]|nr:PD-(D/E)XK nuclease family protein [Methanomassiliicoccus sp.]
MSWTAPCRGGDGKVNVMVDEPQTSHTYSHSRLSCFEQCPRRYQYRYIEEVEVEEMQGIEAFTGTLVHLSLQRLHEEAADGRVLTSKELLEHFESLWKEHYDEACVKVVKRGTSCSDYRMGARVGLQAYHRRYHPFNHGKVVGMEHELQFTVGGRHRFVGYIDMLRSMGEGVYEVHDFKTGRRLPTPGDLKGDRQLALYEIGVRQNFPDAREVRLKWHYLAHDKELTSSRTTEELGNLEAKVSGLIECIESTASFPCRQGPLCRWCEYCDICEK